MVLIRQYRYPTTVYIAVRTWMMCMDDAIASDQAHRGAIMIEAERIKQDWIRMDIDLKLENPLNTLNRKSIEKLVFEQWTNECNRCGV
jgi:hypothetical protein